MTHFTGRDFSRAELLQRVGRIEQIGGITPVTLRDGRAAGVQALDVVTGSGWRSRWYPIAAWIAHICATTGAR